MFDDPYGGADPYGEFDNPGRPGPEPAGDEDRDEQFRQALAAELAAEAVVVNVPVAPIDTFTIPGLGGPPAGEGDEPPVLVGPVGWVLDPVDVDALIVPQPGDMGSRDWAEDQANQEWLPGFGLTGTRGFLGFRERPVEDVAAPGYWSAETTWSPWSAVADLIGGAISFLVGGPVGVAAGVAGGRVASAVIDPYDSFDRLAGDIGLYGNPWAGLGGAPGDGFGRDDGDEPAVAVGPVVQAVATFDPGAVPMPPVDVPGDAFGPVEPAGVFDVSDGVRSFGAEAPATVPAEGDPSPLPALLMAAAAAIELTG